MATSGKKSKQKDMSDWNIDDKTSYKGTTSDHITPIEIVRELGPFDCDPCASVYQKWETARVQYTLEDNGLIQPWKGRVWLNPPYQTQSLLAFLHKMSKHADGGIVLMFSKTDAKFFFDYVWNVAHSILFVYHRISFVPSKKINNPGPAPFGSCLIAYSKYDSRRLLNSSIPGAFIMLKPFVWRSETFREDHQKFWKKGK